MLSDGDKYLDNGIVWLKVQKRHLFRWYDCRKPIYECDIWERSEWREELSRGAVPRWSSNSIDWKHYQFVISNLRYALGKFWQFLNVCWTASLSELLIRHSKSFSPSSGSYPFLLSLNNWVCLLLHRGNRVSREIFFNLLLLCTCSYYSSEPIFFSFLLISKDMSLPVYIHMFWIPSFISTSCSILASFI